MTNIPNCPKCNGWWECCGCGEPLRRRHTLDGETLNVWGSPDVQQYLRAILDQQPYAASFPKGLHGGALLDLNDGNKLECLTPWEDKREGLIVPFMPLPLDPLVVIHDAGGGKKPEPWQIDACRKGTCACDTTGSGWKLTRPLIRGLLGVSDAFLAEHGRDLAGALPCWCLCVATVPFMTEVFFNPAFRFPTREAARAARAEREATRRHRAPRPRGRWSSRPRRK